MVTVFKPKRLQTLFLVLVFVLFCVEKVNAQVDFEDPDFFQTYIPKLQPAFSPNFGKQVTSIINHSVVVAIEQQTLANYPDAEARIQSAIEDANTRMADGGVLRAWIFDHFAPVYDKNVYTGCTASNPNGKNLPAEHCNHSSNYVFIVADEVSGSNYSHTGIPSVEWHGYNGLFGSQGISVLIHELGHTLGLPDMYHISIISANNLVNGQAYQPFQGYIMHNLTPGNFHPWDADLVNRNSITLPIPWNTWTVYQPANNQIKIVDTNNNPLANASINVYTSNPSQATGGLVDTTPEYTGVTDTQGLMTLGNNILGTDSFLSLKAFLIKITYSGRTDYKWMNLTDVNLAYWAGQTQNAVYTFQTSIGVSPTPTPTPSPTFTTTDLKNLLTIYLSAVDQNYFPRDGKVNMLDAGWVTKWMN